MTENNRIDYIATMNPKIMRERLSDSNSMFYKNTGLTPESPLAQKLLHMLEIGERKSAEMQHASTIDTLGITLDDLRSLKIGVFNLYLKFGTRDQQGRELVLDSPEFMAWQGSTSDAKAKSNPAPELTADAWAQRVGVTLKSRAVAYAAQDQQLFIETPAGVGRVYNQGLISPPFALNYGYTRVMDWDPSSPTYRTQPIIYGGDGELDIYAPSRVLENMNRGKPYFGPVVVKSFSKQATHDAKVYLTADVAEVMGMETYYLKATPKDPTMAEVAGLKLPEAQPMPQAYLDALNREKAQFISLTGAQYQAWQYALSENSALRDLRLEEWISRSFGTKEKFDTLFAGVKDGEKLGREQCQKIMDQWRLEHLAQVNGVPDCGIRISDQGKEPACPVLPASPQQSSILR